MQPENATWFVNIMVLFSNWRDMEEDTIAIGDSYSVSHQPIMQPSQEVHLATNYHISTHC